MKYIATSFAALLIAGCSPEKSPDTNSNRLVFVGDSPNRVTEILGNPSIEFPRDGTLVRWYAGYEIVFSNNVANSRQEPAAHERGRGLGKRAARAACQ